MWLFKNIWTGPVEETARVCAVSLPCSLLLVLLSPHVSALHPVSAPKHFANQMTTSVKTHSGGAADLRRLVVKASGPVNHKIVSEH